MVLFHFCLLEVLDHREPQVIDGDLSSDCDTKDLTVPDAEFNTVQPVSVLNGCLLATWALFPGLPGLVSQTLWAAVERVKSDHHGKDN